MFQKLTKILAPVAAAVLLVALPALAVAQTSEQGKPHSGMQDESGAMMDCQQMEKMKEQRQAKQQKMQAELDEMVTHMNAASGDEGKERVVGGHERESESPELRLN